MINIFGQGLCHFCLWAEISFGSKDTPVLDRAEPGDPSEANKDRNQRLSSSAFVNPYFRALRTPF
jgi:hypothetical protein